MNLYVMSRATYAAHQTLKVFIPTDILTVLVASPTGLVTPHPPL